MLDNKRLGKQRVETLQIMGVLLGGLKTIDHAIEEYIELQEVEPNVWQEEICHREVPRPPEKWHVEKYAKASWLFHPAVMMWKGYEAALLDYQYAICYEWHVMRGFEDTCLRKTFMMFYTMPWLLEDKSEPWWLGDEDFHLGHQSNLLRKNPEWYRPMFAKGLRDDLPYTWPTDI